MASGYSGLYKSAPDMPAPEQPEGNAFDSQEKDKILQYILNNLRRMRYFRRQYDQMRADYYRSYLSQKDARFYPDNISPRSNTFVPYEFSNVETIVSRVLDAFFSQDPPFETRGRTPQDEPAAEQMQLNLRYALHKAEMISNFEILVRNMVIYGHAGIKVDWDWGTDLVYGKEPIFQMVPQIDPQTGQPAMGQDGKPQMVPMLDQTGNPIVTGQKPTMQEIPRACPKFTPIDIYDLLIDPDKNIIAHMTEKTYAQVIADNAKYKAQTGEDLYFPEGIQMLSDKLRGEQNLDTILIRMAEFWDQTHNTWAVLTFGEDTEAISWKDLRASFRAASYSPYKRKVYAGEPILLWYGQNPFMHKRAPILATSMIKLPNEVFGLGIIEVTQDLNQAINNFVNMIADNWNTGVNRRYAYDVDSDIDQVALQNFNLPGGLVGVHGDPTKVVFPLPTHTPEPGDYEILGVYKQMIEMAAGVSDFYGKGVGQPSGNRTATGIAQVIGESNYRFRMFIRNLELDIMQPMLEICASMIMQFLPQQVQQMVTNAPWSVPPVYEQSPAGLIGNYSFDVVAANYATNKTVRQRNMMALSNILTQTPYTNQYEALKELLAAFEIRNPKILKTPQQVKQEEAQSKAEAIEMQIFQAMLATEEAVTIADAKADAAPEHNSAGQAKESSGGKHPRGSQHEGKLPGAGLTSAIKDFAQAHGANKLGLAGSGEGNLGI